MAKYTAPAVSVVLALSVLIGVAHAQTGPQPTPQQTAPIPLPAPVATSTPATHCTSGWLITGYFTPVESDYSGKIDRVYVKGELREFPDTFLDQVLLQGSGLLDDGSYLSYGNGWRVASSSYTSSGKPVEVGDVATDQKVIAYGTKLTIGGVEYRASDTGGAIIGKHIDVYMGIGVAARTKALQLPASSTVCIEVTH